MNGAAEGRNGSFSTGAMETKYPSIDYGYPSVNHAYPTVSHQPLARFQPTSVFDETQVRGSANGLGTQDYDRKRVGGGFAPSANGASSQTYDKRLWIDKNPYRTLGG
jgi:hypothetical protein